MGVYRTGVNGVDGDSLIMYKQTAANRMTAYRNMEKELDTILKSFDKIPLQIEDMQKDFSNAYQSDDGEVAEKINNNFRTCINNSRDLRDKLTSLRSLARNRQELYYWWYHSCDSAYRVYLTGLSGVGKSSRAANKDIEKANAMRFNIHVGSDNVVTVTKV